MPRIVSIATAIVWLLLLLVSLALGGGIPFGSPAAMIWDLIVICTAAAAVLFAFKPRRWLGVLLLCISVVPAVLLSWGAWVQLSLFLGDKSGFIDFSREDQFGLGAAVIFVTLALLWAVICLRRRDVAIKT
jgi:hypothetical protein